MDAAEDAFNSTRCIRNAISSWKNSLSRCSLSTPHGALGTLPPREIKVYKTILSTPHGALGTISIINLIPSPKYFQLHTVH